MHRTPRSILALVLAFTLVAGACGDDGGEQSNESDEQSGDLSLSRGEDTGDDRGGSLILGGEDVDRVEAADQVGDEVTDQIDPSSEADGYDDYVTVTDDEGLLSVEIPAAWSDVDGRLGAFGPDVRASTDLDEYNANYSVPGMQFTATTLNEDAGRGPAEILDTLTEATANDCEPLARAQYSDAVYEGLSQIFTDCGGLETGFAWIAVEPSDGDAYTAVVGVQIVTDADVEAYERILASFIVG